MGNPGPGSILLIDDSAVARGAVSEWLEAEGWTVFASASGRSVVERVATYRPDVVLCDLHMPDGDGFGVIDELRIAGHRVPVVIMSCDQRVDAVLSALRRGAFDYVFKASDPAPLYAAVERAVRHMHVVRENDRLSTELTDANEALADRLLELQRQHRRRAMVEDALTLARDHALSASRAKSAFLSHMSHELRTPLNAMLGYAELMAETVEEPRLVSDLGRIVYAGHHLLSLIDDVLDLAKVEAGHACLELVDVDIEQMLDAVRLQAAPAIQQRGLAFVLDVDPAAGVGFRTDQSLLLQCIHQLVDNAIKFTERGQVTVQVRRMDDDVCFDVIDTGCGISLRSQAAIFDAFSQGERGPDGLPTGPGLGLTIAQRVCDLMGGSLELQSEVGVGSTFTVVLPVRPVDEERELESA